MDDQCFEAVGGIGDAPIFLEALRIELGRVKQVAIELGDDVEWPEQYVRSKPTR